MMGGVSAAYLAGKFGRVKIIMKSVRAVVSLCMTSFILIAISIVPPNDGSILSNLEVRARLKKCLSEPEVYTNIPTGSTFPSVDVTSSDTNCRSVINRYLAGEGRALYLGLEEQDTYAPSPPAIKKAPLIDQALIKLSEGEDEQSHPSRQHGSDYWQAMAVNYLDAIGKRHLSELATHTNSLRPSVKTNPLSQTNFKLDKEFWDTYVLGDHPPSLSEWDKAESIPSKREQFSIDALRKTLADMVWEQKARKVAGNREILFNSMLRDGR
ncbi:uncharacterized protein LOC106063640 isoform X1 [Biomphalaria glabrata]|uniref:Uncharacterized protein LOC106063640 isoform X1 n=2 Tax=Biomphalaria glabrata TaxID=6526 RepID=A0A9W2ZAM0_BIOGL|nr:uncharacterized protein LOC106063640 isoform X1 [Biomphalaria glabrata]XP_055872024.1 uncharacterized protein LOC106063640 isoform X1 [Biomphalaria glabrata]